MRQAFIDSHPQDYRVRNDYSAISRARRAARRVQLPRGSSSSDARVTARRSWRDKLATLASSVAGLFRRSRNK